MKSFLLLIVTLVTLTTYSQTSRCCFTMYRDTLTLSEIQALNTTPFTILTPPTTGYGYRLVKPTVLYNHCSASGMTFASGEFINIYNDANVMNVMHQFTDPAVMARGVYSSYTFQTYEVVRNGQPLFPGSSTILDGSVKINSTFPITGQPGDYWVVEVYYEVFTL